MMGFELTVDGKPPRLRRHCLALSNVVFRRLSECPLLAPTCRAPTRRNGRYEYPVYAGKLLGRYAWDRKPPHLRHSRRLHFGRLPSSMHGATPARAAAV